MRMRKPVLATIILFFISAGNSWAVDYKDWIPYFPDELEGLKAQPKKDGVNLDMAGQKTSSLSVTYSDGAKQFKVSVAHFSEPELIGSQRAMATMSIETPELVMKPIEIKGFKGSYHDDKKSKRVLIMLFFNDNAVLHFEADGGKDEKHYVDLIKKIKLKKINATF
jgi:hypothetical protein